MPDPVDPSPKFQLNPVIDPVCSAGMEPEPLNVTGSGAFPDVLLAVIRAVGIAPVVDPSLTRIG